jgi:hypothetical protein
MGNVRASAGPVEFDGFFFDWEVAREPQFSSSDGWKGMCMTLRRRDSDRVRKTTISWLA